MTPPIFYYPPKGKRQMICDFFDNFPLEEAKTKLWDLLKAAMENEQYVLDEKPASAIYFYECLCDLLTAVHSKQ